MSSVLSRLWSPSGFALVVLLLLVPFVGVSCSDQDLGALDGGYTGFDLVSGGAPGYEVDSPVADMVSIEQVVFPDPGARVLAIVLIVLLVMGLVTALLPVVRVRALAGAVVAGLAAVLLVITQLVAQSTLVTSMRDLLLVKMVNVPQDLSAVATEEYLSEVTGSRVGFWLALVVLLAIGVTNVVVSVRARRSRRPPA
jgi:hypothetical protein